MLTALTSTAVAASLAKGEPLIAVLLVIILTETSLLAWVVRRIITGKLVPGSERDYWREAFAEEQRQKRELMVTAQVARGVMQALPLDSAPAPPGGEPR